MALGIYRPEGPPIWRRQRGEPIFTPPGLVEVYDGTAWQPSEDARLKITGRWEDGSDNDAGSLSGRWRASFPGSFGFNGEPMVLYGRARGDLRGLKVVGSSTDSAGQAFAVPVAAYWLGLDAHTENDRPPRGWHPWAARIPQSGTLELQTSAPLRVSLLLIRRQTINTGGL